jgi:hypothetical protein
MKVRLPAILSVLATLLLAPTATFAIWCWIVQTAPDDGVEDATCTACIYMTYHSCRGNDTCVNQVSLPGWNACGVQGTISVSCNDYSTTGAKVDSNGCCLGGALIGVSATRVTITVMIGSGGNCS